MNNESYLQEFKDDLYRVLNAPSVTIAEVEFLLSEIEAGNIDGDLYLSVSGSDCPVCLFGTLCKARGITWDDYDNADQPGWVDDYIARIIGTVVDMYSPIEVYFRLVYPGDTPATSEPLANISAWIKEWLTEHLPAEAAAVGRGEPIAVS